MFHVKHELMRYGGSSDFPKMRLPARVPCVPRLEWNPMDVDARKGGCFT